MNEVISLLQGIPETIATIALSLAFARIPLRWLPIILGGTIISIISSAIMLLPFAPGIHTVIVLFMLVFFITKTTRLSPSISFIVTILSVIILLFFEIITHLTIFRLTVLNLETASTDFLMWFLIGLPQAVIVLILSLLISRIRKPVSNGWKI